MQGDQGEFVLQADEVLNSSDWKKQSEPKPRVPVKDPDLWHSVLAATDVKARASIRLWEEGYKMTPKSDDLSLWAKPKGVIVTKDFGKGKIVLPALTNRIELTVRREGSGVTQICFINAVLFGLNGYIVTHMYTSLLAAQEEVSSLRAVTCRVQHSFLAVGHYH